MGAIAEIQFLYAFFKHPKLSSSWMNNAFKKLGAH